MPRKRTKKQRSATRWLKGKEEGGGATNNNSSAIGLERETNGASRSGRIKAGNASKKKKGGNLECRYYFGGKRKKLDRSGRGDEKRNRPQAACGPERHWLSGSMAGKSSSRADTVRRMRRQVAQRKKELKRPKRARRSSRQRNQRRRFGAARSSGNSPVDKKEGASREGEETRRKRSRGKIGQFRGTACLGEGGGITPEKESAAIKAKNAEKRMIPSNLGKR